jgi:hypothetical protein
MKPSGGWDGMKNFKTVRNPFNKKATLIDNLLKGRLLMMPFFFLKSFAVKPSSYLNICPYDQT